MAAAAIDLSNGACKTSMAAKDHAVLHMCSGLQSASIFGMEDEEIASIRGSSEHFNLANAKDKLDRPCGWNAEIFRSAAAEIDCRQGTSAKHSVAIDHAIFINSCGPHCCSRLRAAAARDALQGSCLNFMNASDHARLKM